MDIFEALSALLDYAEAEGLTAPADRVFTANKLIEALGLDEFEYKKPAKEYELEDILGALLLYAREKGLAGEGVTYGDLFDTKLMGLLLPPPSVIIGRFFDEYGKIPRAATDYYYHLSRKSDYIREYRVKNDLKWVTKTEYGDIDITVNLSKPEKDPKAIAAARNAAATAYPKCMLCRENEGYAGRVNHPARGNHRVIPITIDGGEWFLQYSPYLYYNEHCIVFNGEHVPMVIDRSAFKKLFDFVRLFPHYFVGSNADLPIVGGSILSHEHFQGGNYTFAMAKAPIETPVCFAGFSDVEGGIVKWPMSVIRLRSEDTERLTELSDKILTAWRGYTDEDAFIYAFSGDTPHNTVTPIARFRDGKYEIDLVLRNNITTAEYPDGLYHPHPEYHHIKKENIGLIEVMGLAVLPSRLKTEMALLRDTLVSGENVSAVAGIEKHAEWAKELLHKYGTFTAENAEEILRAEIGNVFTEILGQCGVYKRTDDGKKAFLRFCASVV